MVCTALMLQRMQITSGDLVESLGCTLCSENQKWFVAELRFKKNAFPGMRESHLVDYAGVRDCQHAACTTH